MCCPNGNGCGYNPCLPICTADCFGSCSYLARGCQTTVQTPQDTARSLIQATEQVRSVLSTGNWSNAVCSIKKETPGCIGHCPKWMRNLLSCFYGCCPGTHPVSSRGLVYILKQLEKKFGVVAVALALQRKSCDLEDLCAQGYHALKEALKAECIQQSKNVQYLQECFNCTASTTSLNSACTATLLSMSLLDRHCTDPSVMSSLIIKICSAFNQVCAGSSSDEDCCSLSSDFSTSCSSINSLCTNLTSCPSDSRSLDSSSSSPCT